MKYDTRCFKITEYHGDNEFNIKSSETSLLPGLLHKYAKNGRVGIIERSKFTIKECARATCQGITFKRYKKYNDTVTYR